MRLRIVGLLLVLAGVVQAGTTVIHIEQEGSGDIDKLTGETNLNGAMAWDGTSWIVNNTRAHRFFVETSTRVAGQGLQLDALPKQSTRDCNLRELHCPEEPVLLPEERNGGVYSFTAVQYRVHDNITGKDVVLRARGAGTGTANQYFDIYIDDDVTFGVHLCRNRGPSVAPSLPDRQQDR